MEFIDLLQYRFIQHAILAALLMSVACGITGTYIVARRMVFISGGITHASFGGVGLGFFLGFSPLAGAAIFAVLAALTTENLTRRKILRNDSIIAILWSLGMALGIIFIYLTPGYAPDLMSFLFGSIITVAPLDLWLMFALAILVSLVFILLYKPILYVAFDEQFARSTRHPCDVSELSGHHPGCTYYRIKYSYSGHHSGAFRINHSPKHQQLVYKAFRSHNDCIRGSGLHCFYGRAIHRLFSGYSLGCDHHIYPGCHVHISPNN